MLTLRGKIYSKYKNLTDFANKIGWSQRKVSYVLNHRQNMTLADVKLLASKLDVTDPLEFYELFFSDSVHNVDEAV